MVRGCWKHWRVLSWALYQNSFGSFFSVSSEEFVAVDDDNGCATLTMVEGKDTMEFVQSSKDIIDIDSGDENEVNNAALVPMSSEISNIMKSMYNY
ncbi:hypothetical protein TNCV_2681791 [Trichonephila clavipes]|nr:hypothetical protein TNCV_2681791 [Trichonephila clavipes]